MRALTDSIQKLMTLVVLDPHLESAWLTTLSHMEHLAAEQVLGNISTSTPPEYLEEIKSHADDEYRHRDMIAAIRPYAAPLNESYEKLRLRLRHVAESFVMGYFSNPILQQARSRFVAYVHGALTIEQFPFQIYSAYIVATPNPMIRTCMQQILSEETTHIQLGRKFRESLSEEEHLCLQELQTIEKEMCHKMVERMTEVIQNFLNPQGPYPYYETPSQQMMAFLRDRPVATLAWIYTLGKSESLAARHMQQIFVARGLPMPSVMPAHVEDEMRHSRLLKRSILLERRPWLGAEAYRQLERRLVHQMELYVLRFFSEVMKRLKDPMQIYLYGAWGLEQRVLKHYSDFARQSENIGVAQTLALVVRDEATHTHMVHKSLVEEGLFSVETAQEIRRIEAEIFEKMATKSIKILNDFDKECPPPYRMAPLFVAKESAKPVMEVL